MALVKETKIDKIEIVGPFKMVQVREATTVLEDGEAISAPSFHRRVITPSCDKSGESTDIKAICTAVHTTAIKNAYTAHLEANA